MGPRVFKLTAGFMGPAVFGLAPRVVLAALFVFGPTCTTCLTWHVSSLGLCGQLSYRKTISNHYNHGPENREKSSKFATFSDIEELSGEMAVI